MEEVEESIRILKNMNVQLPYFIPVSTYPAEEADLNLKCITTLKEKFNLPVGYSGHETGVSPSVMAVVLGSEVVERHITLDRAMYGSDQALRWNRKVCAIYALLSEKLKYVWVMGLKE